MCTPESCAMLITFESQAVAPGTVVEQFGLPLGFMLAPFTVRPVFVAPASNCTIAQTCTPQPVLVEKYWSGRSHCSSGA